MEFREVKTAIQTLLGDEAESRFRVVGYRGQSKSTDELTGNNRLVQVYFSDGEFPKGKGRNRGPKSHEVTYQIDMSASAPAQADLSVLDSASSTPTQKAAAIEAIKEAAEIADTQIDELIDYVFNILMDARNESLGLTQGTIASRWIPGIQKDVIIEKGDLVLKTANMKYTCTVQETVAGEIGNEPDKTTFDSDVPIGDTEGAGVLEEVDNT
jgi:hypothetical protein